MKIKNNWLILKGKFKCEGFYYGDGGVRKSMELKGREGVQYHVTGAIERGEGKPILSLEPIQNPLSGDWFIKRGDGRVSREHFTNKNRLTSFLAKGETPSF